MSKSFKIGIICGSFDILHPGYIRMFKDAKRVCKKLIVALQDDPTIDRPHKRKPIQSMSDRREILQSVRYIDEVISYNTEADLYALLKTTDYNVRILGTDYYEKDYTGKDLDPAVYFHDRSHGYSLTALKEAIFSEVSSAKKQKKESSND